jgi:hypothetical protein
MPIVIPSSAIELLQSLDNITGGLIPWILFEIGSSAFNMANIFTPAAIVNELVPGLGTGLQSVHLLFDQPTDIIDGQPLNRHGRNAKV